MSPEIIAVIIVVICGIFGFLLVRVFRQNDKTNDKQDTSISKSHKRITDLDKNLTDKITDLDKNLTERITDIQGKVRLNTQKDDLIIKPLQEAIDKLTDKFDEHIQTHASIKEYVNEEISKLRKELQKTDQ